MTGDQTKHLAQLRQARDNGILDEDTYQAAIAALGAEPEVTATVAGSGAIAQKDSVAAGAGGVAIGHDLHGNVYVGAPPQDKAGALRIYRRVLVATSRHLPSPGRGPGGQRSHQPDSSASTWTGSTSASTQPAGYFCPKRNRGRAGTGTVPGRLARPGPWPPWRRWRKTGAWCSWATLARARPPSWATWPCAWPPQPGT